MIIYLTKALNLNHKIKRYMQTAKPTEIKENTIQPMEPISTEPQPVVTEPQTIVPEPIIPEPPVVRQPVSRRLINDNDEDDEDDKDDGHTKIWYALNEQSKQKLAQEILELQQQQRYDNENIPMPHREPFIIPTFTKESLLADSVIKTVTANVDAISERLGVQIEKSAELTHQWKTHLLNLDKFIESLNGMQWKKIATWTACSITIAAFLWKMGALRKIPHFLGSMVDIIPVSGFAKKGTQIVGDANTPVPSLNLENAYSAILDTPLMPVVLVGSITVIGFTLGALKGVLWALRKLK